MFSYRTDAGAEVDLVIDTGRRILAIECKLGRTIAPAHLGGLRSFATVAGKPLSSYVVFQGDRVQSMGHGIEAVPFREFLLARMPALAGL